MLLLPPRLAQGLLASTEARRKAVEAVGVERAQGPMARLELQFWAWRPFFRVPQIQTHIPDGCGSQINTQNGSPVFWKLRPLVVQPLTPLADLKKGVRVLS